MVSSVSKDINLPISSHLFELLNIIKFHLVFFVFFSFLWSFFVEDLISRWLFSIPLGENPLDLSIYGPYDWIEIQWSMVFLLSIISTMPFLSYSLFKFTSIGLLPKEKNWFSSLLIFNFFTFLIIFIPKNYFDTNLYFYF
ncbi:MAG: twin-arginine translocase subunit TatC, partial [Candidatus Thalassarchaeaceae archaeon]